MIIASESVPSIPHSIQSCRVLSRPDLTTTTTTRRLTYALLVVLVSFQNPPTRPGRRTQNPCTLARLHCPCALPLSTTTSVAAPQTLLALSQSTAQEVIRARTLFAAGVNPNL